MEANGTFDLPETAVRLGIANKTELRRAAPDYFFNDETATGFATGLGDLSLGFKQQLGPTRADLTFRSSRPSAFRRGRT